MCRQMYRYWCRFIFGMMHYIRRSCLQVRSKKSTQMGKREIMGLSWWGGRPHAARFSEEFPVLFRWFKVIAKKPQLQCFGWQDSFLSLKGADSIHLINPLQQRQGCIRIHRLEITILAADITCCRRPFLVFWKYLGSMDSNVICDSRQIF